MIVLLRFPFWGSTGLPVYYSLWNYWGISKHPLLISLISLYIYTHRNGKPHGRSWHFWGPLRLLSGQLVAKEHWDDLDDLSKWYEFLGRWITRCWTWFAWYICMENTIYLPLDVRTTQQAHNPPCGSKSMLNSYRQTSAIPKKKQKNYFGIRFYFFCNVFYWGALDSLHSMTDETPRPAKSAAILLRAGRSPRQQNDALGVEKGDHNPYNNMYHGQNMGWMRYGPSNGEIPKPCWGVKTKCHCINCSIDSSILPSSSTPHSQK